MFVSGVKALKGSPQFKHRVRLPKFYRKLQHLVIGVIPADFVASYGQTEP